MIRTNENIEKDTCGYLGWQVNAAVFSRSEPTLLTEMQLGEELQLLHADHLGNRSLVLSIAKQQQMYFYIKVGNIDANNITTQLSTRLVSSP